MHYDSESDILQSYNCSTVTVILTVKGVVQCSVDIAVGTNL